MKVIIFYLFLFLPLVPAAQAAVPDYKTKTANDVAADIAAAFGSERVAPAVKIIGRDNFVAMYDHGLRKILLSENFYDICKEFGTDSLDALSCVLGHELAHYYENHNYTGGFNEIIGVNSNTSLSKERKKILETEADITGLKYAFFAGYDAYRLLPDVLDRIYEKHTIRNHSGYPSRAERMAIARDQIESIEPLVAVFQSASFLHMAGHEVAAMDMYNYLRRFDFLTPEVLNNMGAVYLNKALYLAKQNDVPEVFAYPCEIDPGDRLMNIINLRSVDINEQSFLENIALATGFFKEAIDRDKDYIPAYMNQATAALLQQHNRQASYYLDIIKERVLLQNRNLPANYYLLHAIYLAKEGMYEEASNAFARAKEMHAYKIDYNINAFAYFRKSLAEMFFDYVKLRLLIMSEDLVPSSARHNSNLFLLTDFTLGNYAIPRTKQQNFKNKVINATGDNAFIFAHAFNKETNVYYRKITFSDFTFYSASPVKQNAPALSEGIALNDPVSKLHFSLGEPVKEYVLSTGKRYMLYKEQRNASQGIIFEVENGFIKGWELFAGT